MGIPWQWPQSIMAFWQESFLLLGEILAEFPWAIDHCLLSLQNSSRNPIQSSVKINAHFKNFPQGPHTQKRTSLWGEWGIWLPNIRISKKRQVSSTKKKCWFIFHEKVWQKFTLEYSTYKVRYIFTQGSSDTSMYIVCTSKLKSGKLIIFRKR